MSNIIKSAIIAKLKEVASANAVISDDKKSDQLKRIESAVLAYHNAVNNAEQSNGVHVLLCTLMGEPYHPLFGTSKWIPQWTVVKLGDSTGGTDEKIGSLHVVLGNQNNYSYSVNTRKVCFFQTKSLLPVSLEEAEAAIAVLEKDEQLYQWFSTNIGLFNLHTLTL